MDPLIVRLGLARDDLGLVGTQVSSSLVRHVCQPPSSCHRAQESPNNRLSRSALPPTGRRTRGTSKPCHKSQRTLEGWTTTCAAHFLSKTGLGRSIGSAGLQRRLSCTQAGKAAAANSGRASKGLTSAVETYRRHAIAIAFMGGVGTETLCDLLHERGWRTKRIERWWCEKERR